MFRNTHKIYFFISFVYQELFPDILFYLDFHQLFSSCREPCMGVFPSSVRDKDRIVLEVCKPTNYTTAFQQILANVTEKAILKMHQKRGYVCECARACRSACMHECRKGLKNSFVFWGASDTYYMNTESFFSQMLR